MNSGRVGLTRRGSVRAVGLLTALLVGLLTAGCGSSQSTTPGAAQGDDRGDLTQLIYRFYSDVEAKQWDQLNSVLADNVTVKSPRGLTTGKDKVIAQTEEGAKQEDRANHIVTNVLVDVTGDAAKVQAVVEQRIGSSTAPKGKIAPEPTMVITSRMHYEGTRTADGWRISNIAGDVLWVTQAAAAPAGQ